MFRHYFISAVRSLKRQKLNSIINIAGLSLGLACCLIILLWIQDELSYDRFHEHRDSIYRVVSDWPKNGWEGMEGTPQNLSPQIQDQVPEVLDTVRIAGQNRKVFSYKDKAFYESLGLIVDPSFFKIFSFSFIRGSEMGFSDPLDMIITERMASKYFGDDDPMGKVIQVDGKPAIVKGVIADIPENSTLRFDYVNSFAFIKEVSNLGTSWGSFNFMTFVRLRPESDPSFVGPKLTEIAKSNKCPQIMDGASFRLQSLANVHLDARKYTLEIIALGDKSNITLFSAVSAFILLLACVNFMNMSTARSTLRSKEVGLRRTVGASRKQLFLQFMGESIILVFFAFSGALLLAAVILPWFNRLSGKNISLVSLEGRQLLSLAILFLVTALMAGSYPSLLLSAFKPAGMMKSKGLHKEGGFVVRRILVVFQFSLTIILLIGTFMIYRQLNFVTNKDLGFDRYNVIQIPIKENIGRQYDNFKQELLKNPSVEEVTAQRYSFADTTWRSSGNFDWEGREGHENLDMIYSGVGKDFFKTMKMELLAGRTFSEKFPSDKDAGVILNEAAVRVMGIDDPVGKWFSSSKDDKGVIIGVIKDVRFRSLHHDVSPRLFYLDDMAKADDMGLILVRIKSGNISRAIKGLRETWEKFNTISPFEYFFLDQTYGDLYRKEQRMSSVFNVFTGLALLISCLGLFGLAAFMSVRRTKEIGIRKILGAEDKAIVLLLSKDFIRWVVLANIIAWPVGYFLTKKLLAGFADRVSLGLGVFVISGFIALMVAQITILHHALRSAHMNPATAIRME